VGCARHFPDRPIHKKVTLGLDLQGGLEVVLKAQPGEGRRSTTRAPRRSVSIMRQRGPTARRREPEIRKQGANQIVIPELAGRPRSCEGRLRSSARPLSLRSMTSKRSLTGPSLRREGNPQQESSLYKLLSAVQTQAKQGKAGGFYYAFGRTAEVRRPGSRPRGAKEAREAGEPEAPITVLALPQNTTINHLRLDRSRLARVSHRGQAGGNTVPPHRRARSYYYPLHQRPEQEARRRHQGVPQMTGSDLKLSGRARTSTRTTNEPVV